MHAWAFMGGMHVAPQSWRRCACGHPLFPSGHLWSVLGLFMHINVAHRYPTYIPPVRLVVFHCEGLAKHPEEVNIKRHVTAPLAIA